MWIARATVANTHSRAVGTPDRPFVVIPVALAAGLAAFPSIPLIAIGMWWTANTAAHNFIHRPFFPDRAANAGFSLLLTTVMGVPQDLWRQRHLSHHAARRFRLRITSQLVAEVGLLAGLWVALAALEPVAVLSLYVPGWLCGLALCAVQGHYEHSRGTTSHYGRIYNALCFNDGYHVEHHARPGLHWTQLPGRTVADARTSRWPPLLRWLEVANLNALERLVTRSRVLQRLVLHCHRRAFEALLPGLHPVRRVAIVGGALFPRTALILRDLLPAAQIVVIDSDPDHIDSARTWLGSDVEFECRRYPSPGELATAAPYDLLVIPLAFDGNRDALYAHPPATTIVHDWLWRPRDNGCVVSLALLKRLNLVRASA